MIDEARATKLIIQNRAFFNQKRGYLRAKIRIFEKFITVFLRSGYENPESKIEDFFRIKSAGSSNYRGAAFFASGQKKPNLKS
jgi:hypothetical protein